MSAGCAKAAGELLGGASGREPPGPSEAPCTMIGCDSGLRVHVPPSWGDRSVQAKTATLVLETEAGPTTCEARLPLPPCGNGRGADVSCRGGEFRAGLAPVCVEGGAAQGEFVSAACPRRVRVTVSSGENPSTAEIAPRYTLVHPNGEACGGACVQASVVADGSAAVDEGR